MMNMALVFCFYSGERPSGVIPQVVRPEVTGRVLAKVSTTTDFDGVLPRRRRTAYSFFKIRKKMKGQYFTIFVLNFARTLEIDRVQSRSRVKIRMSNTIIQEKN